jgi:hypothetical protein
MGVGFSRHWQPGPKRARSSTPLNRPKWTESTVNIMSANNTTATAGTATKTASKSKKGASTATEPTTGAATTEAPAKTGGVAIGPKRKLAFALVGLMSFIAKAGIDQAVVDASPDVKAAKQALDETGYAELKPRNERIADLQTRISEAAQAGDSATVLTLGKELKAVQDGRV